MCWRSGRAVAAQQRQRRRSSGIRLPNSIECQRQPHRCSGISPARASSRAAERGGARQVRRARPPAAERPAVARGLPRLAPGDGRVSRSGRRRGQRRGPPGVRRPTAAAAAWRRCVRRRSPARLEAHGAAGRRGRRAREPMPGGADALGRRRAAQGAVVARSSSARSAPPSGSPIRTAASSWSS